ncbi:MAG: DUF6084 family protein [Actinomycetota bacterium]|nr:DUF6084 family protein [Actinomycetota bacterium]
MTALSFEALDARAEPYAAVPTLMLRLRITEADGRPVHAVTLRCQIMIEPQRRVYGEAEERRLVEMFGETPRWGETLRPFLWTNTATTVSGFQGQTEIDLPITCTYDFEIAAAKYLHALDNGEIPLTMLFSGTTFTRGSAGFTAEPVAWHEEASFRLPVRTWRTLMDQYFPGGGWLRLSRETIDALQRYKVSRAVPTWDDAFEGLLKEAGEDT